MDRINIISLYLGEFLAILIITSIFSFLYSLVYSVGMNYWFVCLFSLIWTGIMAPLGIFSRNKMFNTGDPEVLDYLEKQNGE